MAEEKVKNCWMIFSPEEQLVALRAENAALREACEAALKAMDNGDYGVDVYSLVPSLKRAAAKLRAALEVKNG